LRTLPDAGAVLRAARQEMPKAHLKAALLRHLPTRLAEALAERIGLARELGNCSDADLEAAADTLTALTFRPTGTEGYAKAEVTAGGISTGRAVVQDDGGARAFRGSTPSERPST
jgi:predicted flavoprotein YhiN